MMRPQRVVSLADMIIAISGQFLVALANITQAGDMLYDAQKKASVDEKLFQPHQFEAIALGVDQISSVAESLALDATLDSARQARTILQRATLTSRGYQLSSANSERLMWSVFNMKANILAQTQSRAFYVSEGRYSEYLLSEEPPYGKEVDDAFPTASEEITEAARCLAFERPTAVVFHLMRAMELAVAALAQRLGKTVEGKVWGFMLADINQAIESMPKGRERDAWSAIHSHLYHVKQAWRNDTMHPKTTYTEAQAATVFEAVRSFMIALAPMLLGGERS